MYTHFVSTVPHIAKVAFFKGNSIPTTIRGTVYTHFVYTVPHIAKKAFFKGNSIPTTIRGTVYTHFVYTVPHIAKKAFLKEIQYLLQLEKRCTHILYTPFLIYLKKVFFKGNSIPTTVRGTV